VFYGVKCGVRLKAKDAAVSMGAARSFMGLECRREYVVKRMNAWRDESFSRLERLAEGAVNVSDTDGVESYGRWPILCYCLLYLK
jgi:hypothetical protein